MKNGNQHSEAMAGAQSERLTKDASAVYVHEERHTIYYAVSVLQQSVAAAFPHRFSVAAEQTASNTIPSREQTLTTSTSGDAIDTTASFTYIPAAPKEATVFDDEQLRHVTSARQQVAEAIERIVVDPNVDYGRKDDVELAG